LGSTNIYPHVAVLKPDGSIRKPASWAELPKDFVTRNIVPINPDNKAASRFDGAKLTHELKMRHWGMHPLSANDQKFDRITPIPAAPFGSK
jgi:hypothetical protein